MRTLTTFIRTILRFFIVWVVQGISLLITAALYGGLLFTAPSFLERFADSFAVAFLLGVFNLLIRPLVLLIARPLGFIAVFIIGFFVNAFALLLTSWLLPSFEVTSLFAAIVGGIIFSAINTVLSGILEVNEEGSFYQGLIERLAQRSQFEGADDGKRGLVMMEIDGLSYFHLKHALDKGLMPSLASMMKEEGYKLARVDCGIPSQTSACQAGIMFGDNHDIPAFRWYDKDEQKLYVSGTDAAQLNARYAKGNGLMRQGSSINNMLDGDAEKSLLTMADLFTASEEEKKRRAEDVYLLLLNPYFLTRTLALFFGDVIRELWESWQQRRHDVQPRLNRLAHGYPFVRAATTVFMRDVSVNLAILDIIRGAPSIYVTWPGYDEVAHHSGPWTDDAFKVLASYDSAIERVREAIREKAPRPYDLIILSDHGQSFGPTFLQRYGMTLKEFIEQNLPQGTTVSQSMGGDTGVTSLTAVSGELENVEGTQIGGQAGRALARRARGLVERIAHQHGGDEVTDAPQTEVTAYGSGNLAQVYFDLYPRKITLSELNEAYPGMVDAVVAHEGIGMVCGYEDDGTPIALGKGGRRNLHTGEVVGEDPLLMYAPSDPDAHGESTVDVRQWQVRRVMDFPHAGDLMVISTVYPDGTVAALEELIGNHGGLGGEQTDAFLFHPPDMEVMPTRNSIDVFHILNAHRELPERTGETAVTRAPAEIMPEWSLANLWSGIKDVGTWLGLAARALVLDRSAYREIAQDPHMTGPGLLLGLLFGMFFAVIRNLSEQAGTEVSLSVTLLSQLIVWPIIVLIIFGVGRLLTRKGHFTRTMRTLGFAHVASVVSVLALVPDLSPTAFFLTSLLTFFTNWMGAAVAHETRGWRTLLLPILALVAFVLVPAILVMLLGGVVISLDSILSQLGLVQP